MARKIESNKKFSNVDILQFMEQTREPILAFIVEVTGAYNDTVYGNLYAIGYDALYKRIHEKALDTAYIVMKYEHGICIKNADAHIDAYPDKEYGEGTLSREKLKCIYSKPVIHMYYNYNNGLYVMIALQVLMKSSRALYIFK